MAEIDKKYHSQLEEIKTEGYEYEDPNRKGVIRKEISDYKLKHNFEDGFPAITTKNLYWKGVVVELLWILRGDNNIKYLLDNGVSIWNKDAYNYYCKIYKAYSGGIKPLSMKEFLSFIGDPQATLGGYKYGDIGRGYGAQLRRFRNKKSTFGNTELYGIDQFANLINTLKNNPMATKKTVTFWNPAEKDQCALTPCHWSFEILVEPLNWNERLKLVDEHFGNLSKVIDMRNFDKAQKSKYRIEELHKVADNCGIEKYKFTLKWHQHSVDTFLGEPFNIASYGLLTYILGAIANMNPKGIIGDFSNVHIYMPHMDKVKKQLGNDVNKHPNCELEIHHDFYIAVNAFNKGELTLDEFIHELRPDMFNLKEYKSYPRITAEMLAYSN